MLGCLYCTQWGWFGTRGEGFSGWNVCERDRKRHPSLEYNAVQSAVPTPSLRRSIYSTDLSTLEADHQYRRTLTAGMFALTLSLSVLDFSG